MKYPIGIQNFESIRRDGYAYVDKTAWMWKMIDEGKYYFLSRPRRFGKSLMVSTLEAFFSGQRELFKGLYVDTVEWDWQQYPIKVTMYLSLRHSLGWEPGAKGAEWPETACIILRLGKEDYLVIGSGVVVTFQQRIGLAKCEEVKIVDGKQRIIRHLNGDQTHQGRHVRIPVGAFQIQHFKLYRY